MSTFLFTKKFYCTILTIRQLLIKIIGEEKYRDKIIIFCKYANFSKQNKNEKIKLQKVTPL